MNARALNTVLNVFMPPRCISCGATIQEAHNVCAACWGDLEFIMTPMCCCCGFPLEDSAKEGSLCGYCIQETPSYDAGRSVFIYSQKSKKMITDFKYGDKQHGLPRFAKWLELYGKPLIETADVVVPIPLHRRKLLQRKFNQAALLAAKLAKHTHILYGPEMLLRVKYNPPQASLSFKQRQKNIKGAFRVNPRFKKSLKGQSVLLIDDVMTTGATVKECATQLKKAGAKTVSFLTLARTVK